MLRDYGRCRSRRSGFAIGYAGGYPVVPATQARSAMSKGFQDEWTTSARYLPVPEPGTLHHNPQLAATYRRILQSRAATSTRARLLIAGSSRRRSSLPAEDGWTAPASGMRCFAEADSAVAAT
jgi:gamma-glutamyltranspeptidase